MVTAVDTSTVILECIDGKDDHFKIDLEEDRRIVLGGDSRDDKTEIKELEGTGGVIIVINNNGQIYVDASESVVPVKLNGAIISKAYLRSVDVLKIGNSIWKTFYTNVEGTPASGTTSFTKSFSNLIGLEELKDFKLGNIFSGVFKKHTLAETEEQLFTGTSKNIPAITEIETSWAKPWLFSRLIIACIVLTLALILTNNQFPNLKMVPGLILIGTFVMPIATVVFFLELNAPKNISIFLLGFLFFLSGVGSFILTILVSSPLDFMYKTFSASAAAIIEEPVKMLIVILVMGKMLQFKWILNGLLLGAAVGAGFGAFESAGYAFESMFVNNRLDVSAGVDNIVLRGLLAPFMHVVWTANAAAALWIVKGDKPFAWPMVADPKFLRVFILSVATHFVWNASFGIVRIPVFVDVKFLLLGVISWVVCFMLIQTGLKQLNEARHAELERLRAH